MCAHLNAGDILSYSSDDIGYSDYAEDDSENVEDHTELYPGS